MKTGIITLILALFTGSANAQAITEKHIDFTGRKSVDMKIQITDSISIQTWNKNEVYAKASVNINDNKDNSAYQTSFGSSGSSVTINAEMKENYFKGKKDCCNESKIYWEIFIPEKAAFKVETINGDITIKGNTEGMKAKSISGFIDVAVPSKRDADIELSTITGTIYSNHSFNFDREKSGIPSVISQRLNKGGARIELETISGDIFFRKSE